MYGAANSRCRSGFFRLCIVGGFSVLVWDWVKEKIREMINDEIYKEDGQGWGVKEMFKVKLC